MKVAEELGGPVWVVKSQIPQAVGVKQAALSWLNRLKRLKILSEMIGSNLVTHQTGHEGKVTRVYVEEGCDIARELYLGILVDRASSRITIMASTEGGMDIEEVAAASPEKILKLSVDPVTGLQAHHSRRIGYGLGLEAGQVRSCIRFLDGMYRAFTELDASVVEINPMVVTGDGDVVALDAKMNFDDNALFRHENIAGTAR